MKEEPKDKKDSEIKKTFNTSAANQNSSSGGG